MLRKFLELDGWSKVAIFLLCGVMFLGKASAYAALGIGGLLLLSPRLLWDRWYIGLTRRQDALSEIALPLLLSLLYGFAQVIYGIFLGYSVQTAFQILIFNICPVYMFLGIWVGFRHPGFVRGYIRYIAWYMVIYAPLYFLVLNKLSISTDPDSNFILGIPGTGSLPLLGLLTLEPDLLKFWAPMLVLTCLTIANQERADWLGLGLALMVWGKLTKRMNRVFTVMGLVTAVLLIAAVVDLRLPPIEGRGGELSARGTLARIAGAISPELAAEVTGEHADAAFYYGTVYWRQRWWASIREEVYKEPKTLIIGLGYGYPLARLAGNSGTVEQGTRSPHNIFYFALAYSGFVGVGIFFWLEICIFRLLYRAFKVTGQVFGLAYFVYSISGAFFGNFLESPAAITFYLLLGLSIGPMFLQMDMDRRGQLAEPAEPIELAELV
jgi:hypothetical protein